MRKLVWVVAALVLAGCGEGKNVDAPKPQSAAVTAPAAVAPQWDLEVRGEGLLIGLKSQVPNTDA